jgi:hypothetical protein
MGAPRHLATLSLSVLSWRGVFRDSSAEGGRLKQLHRLVFSLFAVNERQIAYHCQLGEWSFWNGALE